MRPTVNGGFLRYSAAHTSTTGLTFSRAFEGRAFFKEVPGDISVIFSEKLLASIYAKLEKIRQTTCPFINLPEKTRGRWGLGVTPISVNLFIDLLAQWL